MAAPGGTYCERWQALLPVHALGAAQREEAQGLREHLDGCAACRRELEELEQALALLPFGLAPTPPPGQIKDQLMAHVASESQGAAPLPGLRARSASLGPPQPAPVATPAARRRPVLLALTVSALVVALAASLFAVREYRSRTSAERSGALLGVELEQARLRVRETLERLARNEEELRFLRARNLELYPLRAPAPPDEGEAEPAGRVLWDRERGAWLFLAFRLPPPPADRDYQLWFLVRGDGGLKAVSAGLCTLLPGGDLWARVPVPEGLSDIAAAALTLEPKGGVASPTTNPVLVGDI